MSVGGTNTLSPLGSSPKSVMTPFFSSKKKTLVEKFVSKEVYSKRLAAFVPSIVKSYLRECLSTNCRVDFTPPEKQSMQGVVMQIKIVGFANFASSLSEYGTDGCEELGFRLNKTLERLVQIVNSCHGDVISFASHEMKVLWQSEFRYGGVGENLHQLVNEAICCGLRIQEHLHGRPISKHVVNHKLDIRIGIGAGKVQLLHLGGVYKRMEFVLVGPALKEASGALYDCEPGEVVISNTASDVAGTVIKTEFKAGRHRPGEYLRCLSTVHTISSAGKQSEFNWAFNPFAGRWGLLRPKLKHSRGVLNEISEMTNSYIPAAVLPHLKVQDLLWGMELRYVTVMFVRIKHDLKHSDHFGSTELKKVQKVVITLQSGIYQYEGSLNKVSIDDEGYVAIAAFGLPPLAHENDPTRALLAAIQIRRKLRRYGFRTNIGIASGTTYCGLIGGETRREYSLISSKVVVAAQLMKKADGCVICCEATKSAADSEGRLSFTKISEFVDEESQCLDAYLVDHFGEYQPSIIASIINPPKLTLGRDQYLQQLEKVLDKASKGNCHVASIIGDAGLGKTHLVKRFIQINEDKLNLYWGGGDEFEMNHKYVVWSTIVNAIVKQSGLAIDKRTGHLNEDKLFAMFWKEKPGLASHLHFANVILKTRFTSTWTHHYFESEKLNYCAKIIIYLLKTCFRVLLKKDKMRTNMIVIDNCHHMTAEDWFTMIEVIKSLQTQKEFTNVMIIVMGRPLLNARYKPLFDDPPLEWFEFHDILLSENRIELQRWTIEQTIEFTKQFCEIEEIEHDLVEMIHERSDGIPLYIVKFLQLIVSIDAITIENGLMKSSWDLQSGQEFLLTLPMPYKTQRICASHVDRIKGSQNFLLKLSSAFCFAQGTCCCEFDVNHIKGAHFISEYLRTFEIDLEYLVAEGYLKVVRGESLSTDEEHFHDWLDMAADHKTEMNNTEQFPRKYAFDHGFLRDTIYRRMLSKQRRKMHWYIMQYYKKKIKDEKNPVQKKKYSRFYSQHTRLEAANSQNNFAMAVKCEMKEKKESFVKQLVRVASGHRSFDDPDTVLKVISNSCGLFSKLFCCRWLKRIWSENEENFDSERPSVTMASEVLHILPQRKLSIAKKHSTSKSTTSSKSEGYNEDLKDAIRVERLELAFQILGVLCKDEALQGFVTNETLMIMDDLTNKEDTNILTKLNSTSEDEGKQILIEVKKFLTQARTFKASNLKDPINEAMDNIHSWEFDIFRLAKLTAHPLVHMGFRLFHEFHLFKEFKINAPTLINFLLVMESGYNVNKNPYHNYLHGSDVLQTSMVLVEIVMDRHSITSQQILCLLVSAIIHDFIHPGFNGAFCMNYAEDGVNLSAVVERFHLHAAMKVMELPGCNIFENLGPKKLSEVKNLVSKLVLSTDLSKHWIFIEKAKKELERMTNVRCRRDSRLHVGQPKPRHFFAKNRITPVSPKTPESIRGPSPSSFDKKSAECDYVNVVLLLQMCIKVSDVSNAAKPLHLADRWAQLVQQEFYNQGDLEVKKGMQITTFHDRRLQRESQCQITFITKIVKPILECYASFFPEVRNVYEKYLNENLHMHRKNEQIQTLQRSGMY